MDETPETAQGMSSDTVPNTKHVLEHIYTSHHERGSRYGYLYCNGERGVYLDSWIGKGKRVVDLGCRDGELTKYFVEGNEVLGVDIDRKALGIAREKLGIKTSWLDLNTEFNLGDVDYDVVVACEIIEHIYYTEAFLKAISDALSQNGLFIGSVPNAFRFRNRIKFLFGNEFDSDPTHVHMFSIKRLSYLLSKYFRDVVVVPIGGKILPFIRVSSRSPHYLNKLFARDLLFKCNKL